MKTRHIAHFALMTWGLSGFAQAEDILVPADTPSIQGALDSASTGDRILVSAGTYFEVIVFDGKGIEVIGVDGAGVTVLDGSTTAGGPSVLFTGAVPEGATLRGFTVLDTDGTAVVVDDGIATLEACTITGASESGVRIESFGDLRASLTTITGCGAFGVDALGAATLDDCVISSCATQGFRSFFGGAVCTRCLIEGNGGPSASVGGVSSASLIDCVVRGNQGINVGGARDLDSAEGTLFIGNHGFAGPGGYSEFGTFGASITDATFIDNTSDVGVGGASVAAGSDTFFPVTALARRCVFVRNDLEVSAYGISGNFRALADNCTLIDSDLVLAGDVDRLVNSIVRGGAIMQTGPFEVSFSNIEGGAVGTGVIDEDPLFLVDPSTGVVCLGVGSPCIDSGTGTDSDGSARDMGAVPFSNFCDAGNALRGDAGFPRLTPSGDTTAGATVSFTLDRGVPSGTSAWVYGAPPIFASLKGGVLVPDLTFLLVGLPLDATGSLTLSATWPAGVPAGVSVWVQAWMPDEGAASGFAATNGVGILGS